MSEDNEAIEDAAIGHAMKKATEAAQVRIKEKQAKAAAAEASEARNKEIQEQRNKAIDEGKYKEKHG